MFFRIWHKYLVYSGSFLAEILFYRTLLCFAIFTSVLIAVGSWIVGAKCLRCPIQRLLRGYILQTKKYGERVFYTNVGFDNLRFLKSGTILVKYEQKKIYACY